MPRSYWVLYLKSWRRKLDAAVRAGDRSATEMATLMVRIGEEAKPGWAAILLLPIFVLVYGGALVACGIEALVDRAKGRA